MAFRTLDDLGDLTGKRALVRVDLNVPMAEGRVTDLTREIQEVRASTDSASPLPLPALPERWRGEFADRLRAALAFCVEKGADAGWEARSLARLRAHPCGEAGA